MRSSQIVRLAQLPVTAQPLQICRSFCGSVVVIDEAVDAATTIATWNLGYINNAEEKPAFDLSQRLRQTSDDALNGKFTLMRFKNDVFGNTANPNLLKRSNEKAKKPMY